MEEEPVGKVMFDELTDFKLKAAYEAYSKLFDKLSNTGEKQRLNEAMLKLKGGELSFSDFYFEINRSQGSSEAGRRYEKARIQGQRKQEYRRSEQKVERIKRHRR